MKFIVISIIILVVLFEAHSAPKNSKNPKKDKTNKKDKNCKECRPKNKDTVRPICGILNGVENSFRSSAEFACLELCQNVKGTVKDDKRPCEKNKNDPFYKPYWTEDGSPSNSENSANSQFPDPCDCQRAELKQGPLYPVCSAVIGVMTTIERKIQADCLEKCSNNAVVFNHTGPCFGDRAKYRQFLFLAPYSPLYNQTNVNN